MSDKESNARDSSPPSDSGGDPDASTPLLSPKAKKWLLILSPVAFLLGYVLPVVPEVGPRLHLLAILLTVVGLPGVFHLFVRWEVARRRKRLPGYALHRVPLSVILLGIGLLSMSYTKWLSFVINRFFAEAVIVGPLVGILIVLLSYRLSRRETRKSQSDLAGQTHSAAVGESTERTYAKQDVNDPKLRRLAYQQCEQACQNHSFEGTYVVCGILLGAGAGITLAVVLHRGLGLDPGWAGPGGFFSGVLIGGCCAGAAWRWSRKPAACPLCGLNWEIDKDVGIDPSTWKACPGCGLEIAESVDSNGGD